MSRPLMRARCPDANALGTARLLGWRFIINCDGLPSVVRRAGGCVHGVLWRLTPRDLAAINAYENLQSGLYRVRTLPIRYGQRHAIAVVYIARRQDQGTPRPGYIDAVVQAAIDWDLPPAYVHSIARWSSSRWRGIRAKDTGEVG